MEGNSSLEDVEHSEKLLASIIDNFMSPERKKSTSSLSHRSAPYLDFISTSTLENSETPIPENSSIGPDLILSGDYDVIGITATENLHHDNDHLTNRSSGVTYISELDGSVTKLPTSVANNFFENDMIMVCKKAAVEDHLLELVCKDESTRLVSTFEKIRDIYTEENLEETTDICSVQKGDSYRPLKKHWLPCRLFHLACKLDHVTCANCFLNGDIGYMVPIDSVDEYGRTALHYAAESHSTKCIELLLGKDAKTEVKSKSGHTPLEFALNSKRLRITWSPSEEIFKLLKAISEKNLNAIKSLAARSNQILYQLARELAMHGNVVALATLLLVTGDTILNSVIQKPENRYEETLLDIVVKKALSLSQQIQGREPDSGYRDAISMERDILCKEIELILYLSPCLFNKPLYQKYALPSSSTGVTPLIRAVQARDEALVRLLLTLQADVNETDANGNTCLHWCLKSNLQPQNIRVLVILVEHGASVTLGNRLGFTPVHEAAAQGNLHALQIFLNQEPRAVHATAETKETPLFSAVKNNHLHCVRILLQYGASPQVTNLRKQRPMDLANSDEMRALLYCFRESSPGEMKEAKMEILSMPDPGPRMTSEVALSCSSKALKDTEIYSSRCAELYLHTEDQLDSCATRQLMSAKTEICRYFGLPSGCVRGDKCFYAHGEEELGKARDIPSGDTKSMFLSSTGPNCSRSSKRPCEDLSKKIFVGGLSPSVESDDLRDFFEEKFGAVLDAIVIGSHSGDHIQSRGFGFVTFKLEESASAAVSTHFVNIFGKKVEIKGAVPRSILATPTSTPMHSLNELSSYLGNQTFQPEEPKILDTPYSRNFPTKPTSVNLEMQWLTKVKYQHQATYTDHLSSLKIADATDPRSSTATKCSSNTSTQTSSSWVKRFREWLPKFLAEVSSRLKEGEWYPLSSLKGDFRATCGLELDHVPLGYAKLSDFIRSMPELCRMKIVPVGRGPATHMVLLQALLRPTIHAPPCVKNVCGLSPIDPDRSYAAVAGQTADGFSSSAMMPSMQVKNSASKSSQPGLKDHINEARLLHPSDGNLVAQAVKCPNQIRADSEIGTASVVLQNFGMHGTAYIREQENPENASTFFTDRNKQKENASSPIIVDLQSNKLLQPSQDIIDRKSHGQHFTLKLPNEDQQEGIVTSAKESAIRSFTAFDYSFTGFLPQQNSSYTSLNEITPKMLGKEISGKIWPHNIQWQRSPQSILSPFEMRIDSFIVSPSPVKSLIPESSRKHSNLLEEICVSCSRRRAMWAAVPCGHRALCAFCKDNLHKVQLESTRCLLCESCVESWIALY